jgi:hypothetical protein
MADTWSFVEGKPGNQIQQNFEWIKKNNSSQGGG